MDSTPTQDNITDTSCKGVMYPLSAVATPSSNNHSATDLKSKHSKAHCLSLSENPGQSPRNRSVIHDDCYSPLENSIERARTKSNSESSQSINNPDADTPIYCYNTTAIPSPSPTPLSHYSQQEQHAMLSPAHLQNNEAQLLINAIWNISSVIDTFDTLPTRTKTRLLFQLLKRSTGDTLKFVHSLMVNIKRDILATLPHELAVQVILYLDIQSVCRAATVSKTWRSIIDHDKTLWRYLIYKDNLGEGIGYGNRIEYGHIANLSSSHSEYNTITQSMEMLTINCLDSNNSNTDNNQHSVEPVNSDDDSNSNYGTDGYHNATLKDMECALPPINNPCKDDYRRRYILRDNWRRGNFERLVFPSHPTTDQNMVTCLQFDEHKIIAGVDDRVITIYETKTGRHISTLHGHSGSIWALQYTGNTLVSGSTDRTVRVWDIERGVCTHILSGHTSTVRCLQIVIPTIVDGELAPSYPLIVSGSRDSTIRVWRLPTTRTDSPDDSGDGDVNTTNHWHLHTLTGHNFSVRDIAVHGNTLVSGSYDNTVGVFDLKSGRLVHRLEGHTEKVYTVVIDPDRKRCMSGSMDASVRVWDLISGQCLHVLDGHKILVGLLGLSENYIVSAAADATLRIWDADTGLCRHVLSGHQGAITCFQHDEQKVISSSEGELKMWDVRTGKHMHDLITGIDGTWQVAFDRSRCVAAVSRDGLTSFEVLDFGVHGLKLSDREKL